MALNDTISIVGQSPIFQSVAIQHVDPLQWEAFAPRRVVLSGDRISTTQRDIGRLGDHKTSALLLHHAVTTIGDDAERSGLFRSANVVCP